MDLRDYLVFKNLQHWLYSMCPREGKINDETEFLTWGNYSLAQLTIYGFTVNSLLLSLFYLSLSFSPNYLEVSSTKLNALLK